MLDLDTFARRRAHALNHAIEALAVPSTKADPVVSQTFYAQLIEYLVAYELSDAVVQDLERAGIDYELGDLMAFEKASDWRCRSCGHEWREGESSILG